MKSELFLRELGQRLRALRLLRRLSQERLAELAGLSPRYVSQLETGRGNISIRRLFELTQALGVPVQEVVRLEPRRTIVALIGLRGAGKSTIGQMLAVALDRPFFELDSLIEEEAGLGLAELFALHGEDYYRRLEREVLRRFVTAEPNAVLATGGGLVNDRLTFDLLKSSAITVWLKARPEEHLQRVADQGDRRPMAGRADPLNELRFLLREREPLYKEAEHVIDTSGLAPESAVEAIATRVSELGVTA